MRAKPAVSMALQYWTDQTTGTQKAAVTHLGITQPRLSGIKNGRIDLFSLDTLLNMAEQAGLAPTIKARTLLKAKLVKLHKVDLTPRSKVSAAWSAM